MPAAYNQNLQVFQTPDHVTLLTKMVHTVRVVPLDGRPPLNDNIRQWSGDARGHWEGDALVTDPDVWTRSWTASIPMRRTDAPLYEYACHEGNHSLPNMLAGQRAAETVATERP